MLSANSFLKNRRLETLVENQTSYGLKNAEMHIFETHKDANQISLKFDKPVYGTMLQGKKVMHLNNMATFDFKPGESLVLPCNEEMLIDFPDASTEKPTVCLALTILEDKISDTIDFLNENHAKLDDEWKFTDTTFHFINDTAIKQIIQRLMHLFTEDHKSKDVFADYMLQELIIRIVQTETKNIYSEKASLLSSSHRLAFIISYIRKNLSHNLTIKALSNKAYMSESNFHRVFKNELGVSPIEFINVERINHAKSLLQDPKMKIKNIYAECGFNSLSYFTRMFKRAEKISPKEYQSKLRQNNLKE